MQEEWRSVLGFEGLYDVSNCGRVRTYKRQGCRSELKAPQPAHRGYLKVDLYKNSRRHMRYVHRLVLEAFVGLCPQGMECCHGDGIPANSNLENLRWDTRSANWEDSRRHGTARQPFKLSSENIDEIRTLRSTGMLQREIAQKFNVCQQSISNALKRVAP